MSSRYGLLYLAKHLIEWAALVYDFLCARYFVNLCVIPHIDGRSPIAVHRHQVGIPLSL